MTEAFLQYVWQHELLDKPLTTTEGLSVVVERPGELNRDAGPDFLDARLTIGNVSWAGNVEVHIKSSDWNLHGHSKDKNYNNVILHVVYANDAEITLQNGKKMPTLAIADAIPQHVWENYERLMNPDNGSEIACEDRLKEIPDFLFQMSQERLLVERLERKSANVQRILKESKGNWEQACYIMTAHYLGAKANAFPFELLAKKVPMSIVAKIKDDKFRVESLYFGQAGLLEDEFHDEYPQAMQREYKYMSIAYKLEPMAGHLWRFFRIRPAGFPTLRISQLAALMGGSANMFSKLLDTTDIAKLRELFDVHSSEYWQTHYSFDNETPWHSVHLGQSVVDAIIINAWVPLLFEYGAAHDDEKRKEQALMILQQLPAENNRIVRLWTSASKMPRNAADTQAFIQRYTEYCSRRRCLDCQIAFRLIKCKK